MIKNYIATAIRNLKRHKLYSIINIAGLTLGFAVSLVIMFYIIDDLTFDRFHANAENIYRVLSVEKNKGTKRSITSGALIMAAKENIPEVRGEARFASSGHIPIKRPGIDASSGEGAALSVTAEALFADNGFWDVFDFKILAGVKKDALTAPGGVFLTQKVAKALFGEENPLGKPILTPWGEMLGINEYVAGIVEAPPSNSHIQFDALLPLVKKVYPLLDSWQNMTVYGYVSLTPNADPALVEKKMRRLAADNNFPETFEPRLQSMLDVHLGSADHLFDFLNRGKNDILVVYIMGAIGLLIFLIACINYINHSTAIATKRAAEVGIRKVVGANRRNLAGQFLGESVLMTIISFFIALIIVKITLPHLDTILKKQLEINFSKNPLLIVILFAAAVLIGLLSGIYPALVLSAFKPINILKGKFQTSKSGILLRKTLVVFQFFITISLIVGVLIMTTQITFLQSMDMGYNRENVLVIFTRLNSNPVILKNKLANLPGVVSIGQISDLPGPDFIRIQVFPEGKNRSESYSASRFLIDEGFFKTLDISILKGRNFSKQFTTDASDAIIVNETQVKNAGWDINNMSGKRLGIITPEGNVVYKQVIGVSKDFHFSTARQAIEPMVFFFAPAQAHRTLVRLTPGNISEPIKLIEAEFKKLYPDQEMLRSFLDESFELQFTNDRDLARNIWIFVIIGIIIASLGLIGLVSYAIEQRRREIAVRKVFGCSELKIMGLLSEDFLKLVLLANVLAWFCGYFVMRIWMNEFVYRVPLTIWPFLLAALGSLIFSLLSISFQTVKAARTNPADSLREVG